MTKKLIYSFLFTWICWPKAGFTQVVNTISDPIPVQYQKQFKEDQKQYEEFILPYSVKSGDAYARWNNYNKGYLRGRDIDSLYRVAYAAKNLELSKMVEFIRFHPNSYASLRNFQLWILHSTRTKPDSLLTIYNLMSTELHSTPLGKSVLASISQKQSLQLGKVMPEFSFRTSADNKVSLSDFKGRNYVLLCFWASWCGPCVKNIPFLKQVSEIYSPKGLKMISVSIDDNVKNWISAVEKHGLTWMQTCDVPSHVGSNKISALYEVALIPQYFLIDRDGKLIYQSILSEDDDQYSRFRSLLATAFD